MRNYNNKKNEIPLIPKNTKNYSEETSDTYYPNRYSNKLFDSSIIKNRPLLDRPGKIKYAKKHASADRPLHKIRNFTKETDFCQCCNLPCETKNIIEPYKICDSTDIFSECGLGISLYFYYFRFCILCLIIIFLVLALPLIIFNKYYSNELNKACDNNIYNKNFTICDKYEDNNEFYNYTFVWLIPYSSDVVNDYIEYGNKVIGNNIDIKDSIINYSILNFLSNLTLFIISIYFFILLKLKIYKEKSIYVSPSDYTLFINNLNNSLDYFEDYCISKKNIIYNDKERFKSYVVFLKNKILLNKKKSGDIYDINFCYKLKDFMKAGKKVQKINYELLQIVNNLKQKKLNEKYHLYGEKRKYFEIYCGCVCKKGLSIKKLLRSREINQIKLNYLSKNAKILTKNNFAGAIFVTFNTMQQKEEYYSRYNQNIIFKIISFFKEAKYYFCCCCINEKSKKRFFRRKNIKVNSAPEPEDVIWENIEYNKWFRFKRLLLIYTFTLFLLSVSFLIVLGLTYLKEYLIQKKFKSYFIIKYGFSLLITASISGINEVFYYLLEKLTKKEKQISMTNFYLSYSVKLTFFTFITSGIVPLVCNAIENGNNNESLVDNMVIIFLVNSFLTPLLWSFDVDYLFRKIKIFYIERKANPDSYHNMTQRELNELYQLPDMKISYKYSYVAKTLLLSFFYIPIFPFGIIISLIGFIFAYYLELFNFTHLYNRPEMINEKICLFYAEYFAINLFFFNLGLLIFMNNIFSSSIKLIFNLIIFGILSIFPFTKLINFECLKLPKRMLLNTSTTYEDVYFSFYNDYQRQNPITKIDGLKNYITKLRINGYISQKVYNFSYMNIDTINVMELYYRSRLNRNIVQSQIALANYNNSSIRKSINRHKKRKKGNGAGSLDSDIKKKLGDSALYDEQLTNLLKQSIYRQKFGNNLDDLNKILSNKKIFNSNNAEIDLEKNSNKSNEDIKNESDINEKNKDYILKQYNNPFLLSISHNITNGDLRVFHFSDNNNKKSNLENIPETNEEISVNNENNRDKNFYGVDFDIYSKKSSLSENSNKNEINIEMQDLTNNDKKIENKYNYEMSDINNKKEEEENKFERITNINIVNKKNKKININKIEKNYDGDFDSDYGSDEII